MLKTIISAILFVVSFFSYVHAAPANLWVTGQTASYRAGDDGDVQAGVAWPNLRFTPGTGAEAECVTDNLTALMWSKNANLPNGRRNWQGALDFANDLTVCGYNDWRLPNRKELRSLIDYSHYSPALPSGHPFVNVQAGIYLSSSTSASDYYADAAWVVYMYYGNEYSSNKDFYYYVWPVRSGQVGLFGDLAISPTSHDFGNVNVGNTSTARTFIASNTGTAELEIYDITITGTDKTEFSIQNDNCSTYTILPGNNCTFEIVFSPVSVGIKSADISVTSNDPDENPMAVQLTGEGILIDPIPDIKANGSDGPITISSSQSLQLTIALDSGSKTGTQADWWVLCDTPWGWYNYNLTTWVPGQTVTYQGPLADLATYQVMNMTLPAASMTCYFGVDTNRNGSIDLGVIYYDSVGVTITP